MRALATAALAAVIGDAPYSAAQIAGFPAVADPVVYTPGDNEWTDCHRASAGGYLPTERLALGSVEIRTGGGGA